MRSNIATVHQGAMPENSGAGMADSEIAEKISNAIVEVQESMDSAMLAGLIVDPSFTRIENRLTKCGVRIDSYVCKVNIFRKLA